MTSMSTQRRVCAWCMHPITDQCQPFTVVYAGRQLHYCDTDQTGHSCYIDHLNGVTQSRVTTTRSDRRR